MGNRGCISFFFIEFCLYVETRELLRSNLRFIDSLIIEHLLFGNDSSSEEQNSQIFKSVQLYILKRDVLSHSDHTSYIEFKYFLLCNLFLNCCFFFHEYDNPVLLRKDILNSIYYIILKIPFFSLFVIKCNYYKYIITDIWI